MSRHDLKELGEHLDAGQAGLVVVGVSDMGAKIERSMKKAQKVEAKQLKADTAEIEADARSAQGCGRGRSRRRGRPWLASRGWEAARNRRGTLEPSRSGLDIMRHLVCGSRERVFDYVESVGEF